jgi:hypothetical protein
MQTLNRELKAKKKKKKMKMKEKETFRVVIKKASYMTFYIQREREREVFGSPNKQRRCTWDMNMKKLYL